MQAGEALMRLDGDAFARGTQKAALILKGLTLKPSSAGCREVGRKLEENAVLYRELAARLP